MPKYLSNGETRRDQELAWEGAFACMPNLQSITFDIPAHPLGISTSQFSYDDILPRDQVVMRELAQSAAAWSHVMSLGGRRNKRPFRYLPDILPVTEWTGSTDLTYDHAFIAVDEGLPKLLSMQLAAVLRVPVKDTLGCLMTGIPDDFFISRGFNISYASAFSDMLGRARLVITYQKRPEVFIPFAPKDMEEIFDCLGLLSYLRIAGRYLDGNSALQIPSLFSQLKTLDVAFTDADPDRVIAGLTRIEERCGQLYSLSIDLSPLHDRQPGDHGEECFFDRKHVHPEMALKWQPFWTKLDQMAIGRGKVHEGETPGYRRS